MGEDFLNKELPDAQTLISEAIWEHIFSLCEDDDEWNNTLANIVEGATVIINGENYD